MTMFDWDTIDTVLLDMDGTLLDLHYDNYFWADHLPRRYAELKQLPLDDAQQQLEQHIRSLEGTLNWYCLDYWSSALEVDIGELKSEIKHKIKERPYTHEFLTFLKQTQKTVALVTNAHPIGLDIKLEQTQIGDYLDHIISSHQFQQPKEEQGFWHQLQAHLPFDPARTLFIDDNAAVLTAGRDYGIAYTLGIHQPDSQIQRRLEHNLAIEHFNEIIPATHG